MKYVHQARPPRGLSQRLTYLFPLQAEPPDQKSPVNISKMLYRCCYGIQIPDIINRSEYIKKFSISRVHCCNLLWWRHEMHTLSALLALCERNPPVAGTGDRQIPLTKGRVMQSFGVSFDDNLNNHMSKQSIGRWIQMFGRLFHISVMVFARTVTLLIRTSTTFRCSGIRMKASTSAQSSLEQPNMKIWLYWIPKNEI